jgi:hypothetical protein
MHQAAARRFRKRVILSRDGTLPSSLGPSPLLHRTSPAFPHQPRPPPPGTAARRDHLEANRRLCRTLVLLPPGSGQDGVSSVPTGNEARALGTGALRSSPGRPGSGRQPEKLPETIDSAAEQRAAGAAAPVVVPAPHLLTSGPAAIARCTAIGPGHPPPHRLCRATSRPAASRGPATSSSPRRRSRVLAHADYPIRSADVGHVTPLKRLRLNGISHLQPLASQ